MPARRETFGKYAEQERAERALARQPAGLWRVEPSGDPAYPWALRLYYTREEIGKCQSKNDGVKC